MELSSASNGGLNVIGGNGLFRLACTSRLRPESLTPSVQFEWRRTFIRPKETNLKPLTDRDTLANGKHLFELINTYEVKITSKATVIFSWPVSDNLYGKLYHSLLIRKRPRLPNR